MINCECNSSLLENQEKYLMKHFIIKNLFFYSKYLRRQYKKILNSTITVIKLYATMSFAKVIWKEN